MHKIKIWDRKVVIVLLSMTIVTRFRMEFAFLLNFLFVYTLDKRGEKETDQGPDAKRCDGPRSCDRAYRLETQCDWLIAHGAVTQMTDHIIVGCPRTPLGSWDAWRGAALPDTVTLSTRYPG